MAALYDFYEGAKRLFYMAFIFFTTFTKNLTEKNLHTNARNFL